PSGLNQVISRMLAKDPGQRYQSCADALADLRAVQAGRKPLLKKIGLALPRLSVLAAAIIVAGLLLPKPWTTPTGSSPIEASSRQLVVLPFRLVTDDESSRAFASGLTETMSAKLGQIADRYPLEIVALSEAQKQKVSDAQQARAILGATMT